MRFLVCTLLLLMIPKLGAAQDERYDVIVYGATASGVMAAIAAAEENASVLLIEPGRHLGGMVSGGLSHTDFGDRAVIGGYALEFYRRVGEYYDRPTYFWRGPEPRVAEDILREWLDSAGVDVEYGLRIDDAEISDRRIRRVVMDDGSSYTAEVFIDAGYEGDLMARSGVSYTFGREGRDVYDESWAGRLPILPDRHQFTVGVSPFASGSSDELLPLIKPEPMVEVGEGDRGIQAYGFRLLLTRRPDLRIPFPRPDGYDPGQFELMRRLLDRQGDQLNARYFFTLRPNLPNEKAEINSVGPISLNVLDGTGWKYPDADYPQRDEIWAHHLHYAQSLMYFMANDPSVPEHIRSEVAEWGLSSDEFVDTEHWPHQLYVRTGRRIIGEHVMTQHDLEVDTLKYDAIGMGSYNIDVREVQRSWIWMSRFPELHPEVYNEGYLSIPVSPYQIPYRSILPKSQEVENLLVPVCLSSSHVANASIRMEPQYMILGQAAGAAAALAVRDDVAVQHVGIPELQRRLLDGGQILSLEKRPNGPFQSDSSFLIDDDMRRFVEREGSWEHFEDTVERHAMSYLVAQDESSLVRFRPDLPEEGEYDVLAWWPPRPDVRATITVHHADGVESQTMSQREGGKWIQLGTWPFEGGRNGFVEMGGQGAAADAVRFDLKE